MKQVRAHSSTRRPPVDDAQHYDAMHGFECSECDRKFRSEVARDQVLVQLSPTNGCLSLTTV